MPPPQPHNGGTVKKLGCVGRGARVGAQACLQVEERVHAVAQVFAAPEPDAAGVVDPAGHAVDRRSGRCVGGCQAGRVPGAGIDDAVHRGAPLLGKCNGRHRQCGGENGKEAGHMSLCLCGDVRAAAGRTSQYGACGLLLCGGRACAEGACASQNG